MKRWLFPTRASQYIFFEIWPALLAGIGVFLFILTMSQALRYTEFVLIHGVSLMVIAEMLVYITISFLPALLPMAALFAVLMTYGRLSQDSEVMALRAAGYSMWTLLNPALTLALLLALLSMQTSLYTAPWGNRQFELLVSKIMQGKAGSAIREGAFSEGFFGLVVYANSVESRTGLLGRVFIFNERDSKQPVTIVAQRGQLLGDPQSGSPTRFLRLENGSIHSKSDNPTKVNFRSFDLSLWNEGEVEVRGKSTPSLTVKEIRDLLETPDLPADRRRHLQSEVQKRYAFPLTCLVFALLGVALGTTTHVRHQTGNNLLVSLLVIVGYWLLYVAAEGMAREGQLPVLLAVWAPNVLFGLAALWLIRKSWA